MLLLNPYRSKHLFTKGVAPSRSQQAYILRPNVNFVIADAEYEI